ncbi:hypothetical protein K151_2825 [Proteus hauseri ZMd44]|nr:hypothetical protein K151_2825 [Proteus hauseri ZMd44]
MLIDKRSQKKMFFALSYTNKTRTAPKKVIDCVEGKSKA